MTIQKKDLFKTARGKTYEVAGRCGSDVILSPVNDSDDQCIVYTAGEIEELLEEGKLYREGSFK